MLPPSRIRRFALPALLTAAGLAALAWLSLAGFAWNDYDNEARVPLEALLSGRLGDFAASSPGYGGSLVLRAPFAAVVRWLGGGELAVYRAVALPGLLAAGALGAWLAAQLRSAGASRLVWVTALLAVVANPISMKALEFGHAEELLGASLCVAAVIAAGRGHWLGASVLAGLAVANKPWALVAVPVIVCVLERRRLRSLAVIAAVAVLVTAPLLAHDVSAGGRGAAAGVTTGPIFHPWQAWWSLGDGPKPVKTRAGVTLDGYRTAPRWLGSATRPLLLLSSVLLTLALSRRRRPGLGDALALLVLLLLARCALDPWNSVYYAVPSLFALAAWEALVRREAPVLTLGMTVAVWASFIELQGRVAPDVLSLAYLGWMLPAIALAALRLYAPASLARLVDASRALVAGSPSLPEVPTTSQ